MLSAQSLPDADQWFRLSQQVMIHSFPNTVRELLKAVTAFLTRLLTPSKGLD